jgi:hypothetical protein
MRNAYLQSDTMNGYLGVHERIILKWGWEVKMLTGFNWLRMRYSGGLL